MTFLAALAILVHAVLAGAWATPTPAHGVTVSPVPAPAAVAPVRKHPGGTPVPTPTPPGVASDWSSEGSSRPATAAPSVPAGQQLPTEVIGRAVTCPDGSTGYVVDVDLNVSCPDSTPAGP